LVQRTEGKKVPQVIAGHYHYLKNPLFFRVR
jgi:hypothetical protein